MKKRIHIDVIFFISLLAFFVLTGSHVVAGENQLIRFSPEEKTILVVVTDPADNKTHYAVTQFGLLKSTDTDINWLIPDNSLAI